MVKTEEPIPFPNLAHDPITAEGEPIIIIGKKRTFVETVQMIVLFVLAGLLVYFFMKFIEQDVSHALHFSNYKVHVEPAGY